MAEARDRRLASAGRRAGAPLALADLEVLTYWEATEAGDPKNIREAIVPALHMKPPKLPPCPRQA